MNTIMEIKELYDLAKQYAELITNNKPNYVSENESAICVIVDNNDQPITGITTVTVRGGMVEVIPAETVAVKRFIDHCGDAPAKYIVTMLFKNYEVIETGKVSLLMLGQTNAANGECVVMTSAEDSVKLKEVVLVSAVDKSSSSEGSLVAEATAAAEEALAAVEAPSVENAAEPSMEDLMNGFDVDTTSTEQAASEPVGAPAEFADGFSVDSSNPFFEEAATAPDSEVKTIDSGVKSMFDQPEDATRQGAAGFNIPQGGYPQQGMTMQGGYPQQGMGFPQQGMQQSGYPQQGMGYPQQGMQQSGYPQQGMQAGYPQQGMGYPQQGMQAGYPQQGMGYPQQGMQGGYPQQGMGYPQQGMQQGGYPQQGAGYPQQGMQGGYPQQGTMFNTGTTTTGGFPQAGVMQSMMKMPGVGQTSIQVSESATSIPVSQNIKSLNTDEISKYSSSASEPDDDEDEDDGTMSREDMLKAAKQKKKNAKLNANFKKKMRDSGF